MNSPTLTTITKTEARAANGMVATKDVHATMAGVSMLENGGNAVDAAVAACFAIGVVEPASSGIGGGGYLVYQVGDQGGVIGFPMKGPLAAHSRYVRADRRGRSRQLRLGRGGQRREPGRISLDRRAGRGRRTVRSAQTPGEAAAQPKSSLPRSRWPGTATLPAGTTSTPSASWLASS